MKRLSEYKNEEAVILLADLFVPVINILSDEALRDAHREHKSKGEMIKIALKNHPTDVINALAILEGVDASEYDANPMQITIKLLQLMNDKDLIDFFGQQVETNMGISSSSASENTEDRKE